MFIEERRSGVDDWIGTIITVNDVTATINGDSFSANLVLLSGSNTLTVVARAPDASTITQTLTVTYVPTSIVITSPTPGASIAGDRVLVQGTFQGPVNMGITVNGMAALVYGHQFLVNNVPLTSGENTLTVVASTADGEAGQQQVTVTANGSVPVSVERVTPRSATVATIAGNGTPGYSGDGGPASAAQLNFPYYVAVGPDGSVYVSDYSNVRIRRIDPSGTISTVAGTGQTVPGGSGDGGLASQASFEFLGPLAFGPDGSLYVNDAARIRRIGPNGVISTVAGNGSYGNSGDGGPAVAATLSGLEGIAVGADGSLYLADAFNCRIRKVDPAGIITAFAGTGECGYAGDGGSALAARFSTPSAVALAPDGSLYVADSDYSIIRRIAPDAIVSTVAGNGSYGNSGEGVPATQAQLGYPNDLAFDAMGNLYLADYDNSNVRRVDTNGIITTVAGSDSAQNVGDGGAPHDTVFSKLSGLAFGGDGTLYLADSGDQRIRAFNALLPTEAVSAQSVGFSILNNTGKRLTKIEADFNGDGTTDSVVSSETVPLQYTYPGPGIYTAAFTVTDETGQVYHLSYAVVVEDMGAKDAMLRGVYTTMLDRLKAGNTGSALNMVTGGMREKYNAIFTALAPSMATVVDQLGTLQTGTIGEDMAEYVIVRTQGGTSKAFLIYLIRSEDGVWRIDGM